MLIWESIFRFLFLNNLKIYFFSLSLLYFEESKVLLAKFVGGKKKTLSNFSGSPNFIQNIRKHINYRIQDSWNWSVFLNNFLFSFWGKNRRTEIKVNNTRACLSQALIKLGILEVQMSEVGQSQTEISPGKSLGQWRSINFQSSRKWRCMETPEFLTVELTCLHYLGARKGQRSKISELTCGRWLGSN